MVYYFVALTSVLAVVLLALVRAVRGLREEVARLRRAAEAEPVCDHNKDWSWGLWAMARAQVLRDAAEDWPKVHSEAERAKLSWVPEVRSSGKPMVVHWLLARADKIEKGEFDDETDSD